MEESNELNVEGQDGNCYPFGDLSRLRADAGAFMEHVLSEKDEEAMEEDHQHVVTPDYQMFASSVASTPNDESHGQVAAAEPLAVLDGRAPGNSQASHSSWNAFGATAADQTPHTSLLVDVEARNQHTFHHYSPTIAPMTSTKATAVPPTTRQRSSPVKRSRSIQIKRASRRGSHDESSSISASAEQMYDWATWRMYHRITSARRNKSSVTPLPSSDGNAQDAVVSSSRTYRGISGFPKDGGESAVDSESSSSQKGNATATTTTQEKNDFEEGVFVMDL